MDTTRFDLLALMFTGLALLGLPRLFRGWRALIAPEPSVEGSALAVYVAVFLAVPVATLAHELGHLVVARSLGATDATLHYRIFWGFVDYSTWLPGHGNWWVSLAGNAVSWALAALGLWIGSTRCGSRGVEGAGLPTAMENPAPAAHAAIDTEIQAASFPEPPPMEPSPAPEGAAPEALRAPGRARGLPPGLCEAARVFGMLEMIHTLVAYPLMSLGNLPGADWAVIYGQPFWAGTCAVAAVHAASLLWLWRVLRRG
jgi:hypothetical protein